MDARQTESEQKLNALKALLESWDSVAIGFSGGVDSTFLAAVCAQAIPGRALLVRLDTTLAGTSERASVAALSQGERGRVFGLPLCTIPVDPLLDPLVAANSPDRCYWCKRAGFAKIIEVARERGFAVVADGSNADDAGDYRPGMRALHELGVRSPLMETGWRKEEERALLRAWGCDVWNMPAGACLATRVPCGEPLTQHKIDVIRACEDYLHEQGALQVRARLVKGRVYVEMAADDIARFGNSLSDVQVRELETRAGCPVESTIRPYVSGAMNK